ncbi:MBL fold metallo-hydrolase [Flavicella marina]|uniref:MBL fold metallo-hydrolase n=1 Tax=Flavicella marina TaxID=1475951 RepID=UPI00186B0A63|nr:MBL fold metallo-hydrolase [Flavicella marina]
MIQHPKGNFLFDTGFDVHLQKQFKENTSFLNRQTFKFKQLGTTKNILEANNYPIDSIKFIIPSHFHYDHVSGIEDFPNADTLFQETK